MNLTGVRQKVFLDRYALKGVKGELLEHDPSQMWQRVAKGIAKNEKKAIRKKWEKKFYQAMEDFKFVPGGRILSGAGTDYQVTYFNCFVIPSPKDSREGILESLKQLVEIQARSGGVGLNLSSLRPKGARVKKVNGTSSGPVNWAELFSVATHDIVQQGGCFTKDAKIMTHLGLVPISEIIESKSTFYASTHQGYKKITTRFDNGIKDIYEVATLAGFKVKVTLKHKFLTFDNNGKFYLKALSDFKVGDNVVHLLGEWRNELPYAVLNTVLPTPSKYSNGLKNIALPRFLNEDLAFIIGAYDADGSRIPDEFSANGKGIRIAVADNRPHDLQKLIAVITRCFNVIPKIRKGDGAVTIVQVFSRRLNEFLKLNGLLKDYSVNVAVPVHILTSPRRVVEAYVAGFFLGDGTNRGGKGGLRMTTVSHKFAQDLQLILLNLGIASKIKTQLRKEKNWRTIYTVTVNGAVFMKRFIKILAPYTEKVFDKEISVRDVSFGWPFNLVERFLYIPYFQRTQARTNTTTSQKSVLYLQQMSSALNEVDRSDIELLTNCLPDVISSITYLGEENVYDLEVENVHLLSGNGFYTSNSRRGATMIMLWDWHPDIEEFITVKQDLTKINGANLSVCISDSFMEAVKKNKDWDLIYPDLNDPMYDDKWNGEIDEWKKIGGKVKVYKTVKAKYLWDLICTAAWRSAEPGLHFLERSNKRSNTASFEKLIATNPCLTGDTLVTTKDGWKRVDTIKEGEEITTVLGSGIVDKVETYENKLVFRVKLSDGAELRATAAHQFHAIKHADRAKNSANKRFSLLSLAELEKGDILRIAPALMPENKVPGLPKGWSEKDYGFFMGILLGDGCITEKILSRNVVKIAVNTSETEWVSIVRKTLEGTGSKTISLDAVAQGYSANLTVRGINGIALMVRQSLFVPSYSFEKKIPLEYQNANGRFLAGILDGLFSTDGNIDLSSNHPFLRFKTTSKQLALDIRRILLCFGIHGRITTIKKVANGHIGDRVIVSKHQQYEIIISGAGMKLFAKEIGISHPGKSSRLKKAQKEFGLTGNTWLAKIVSIEPDGIEKVYDLHEPISDTWIAEGVVSRGCGEQPLGAWAVCNLGAMNLAAYVKNGKFDYKNFGLDVRVAMRFMDNVIDQTYYFFSENEKCAKDIRRTGLGIMGLGDALIKMKIRYGSKESLPVIEKIFMTLRDNAYEASSNLSREKGAFPKFDKKKYLKGYHIKALPKKIQKQIAKHGIRNAVLLTIAPTGTTSLVAGVTSGIEPVYEFTFVRKDRTGMHTMYHPLFEEWKKQQGLKPFDSAQGKPDYFVSANDLTPLEHAKVQAVAQEYIDSSISKTVNAPNSHTVENVKILYMAAYDLGLKGITYMREGSREGVLSRITEGKIDNIIQKEVKQAIIKRPMVVEGVTYQTKTPVGDAFITINHNENKEPFEVFITIGKSGSDIAAMAEALGRTISLNLRTAGGLPTRERVRLLVAQLAGIGGARSVGFGKDKVRSLPDAVAKILARHYGFAINGLVQDKEEVPMGGNGEAKKESQISLVSDDSNIIKIQQLDIGGGTSGVLYEQATSLYDICPDCGGGSLAYEEGCRKCYSCGYSEC